MIEERLAAFAHAPLTGAPRDVFALSLIDWAACGIAGRNEPVSRAVRRWAEGEGQGDCACFGRTEKERRGGLPARAAALVNGTTSHALDYDDTHFAHVGHPSVAVMPAALAVAEAVRSDGGAFRDAALVGMEASVRVGVWLGRSHYEAGFHQTATAGAFGAALACARLMDLSEARTVQALRLCASMASGLRAQFGTSAKPLNAGIAAAAGVDAARLAEAGVEGGAGALDGPLGFGATHAGASADLPEGRWLMEDVSHKLHACCHGLHAMLEALRGQADPGGPITVRTNPRWLTVCDILAPRTGLEAKFSYRLTAAMALAGWDTARLGAFSDEACADPDLTAIRDRVSVIGDGALSDTQVAVEIDGATLTHDLSTQIPLEERAARVRAKVRALVGDEIAGELDWLAGEDDIARWRCVL